MLHSNRHQVDSLQPSLTIVDGKIFESWLEYMREAGIYNMILEFEYSYLSACALAIKVEGWNYKDIPGIYQSLKTWLTMNDEDRVKIREQSSALPYSDNYISIMSEYGIVDSNNRTRLIESVVEECIEIGKFARDVSKIIGFTTDRKRLLWYGMRL